MKKHCPVAIVGMSCFFPKSSGLKAYWRLLFHGQDAITEIPATHWSKQDYFDPDPTAPDHVYCARGGFLSAVDFDPSEFGIPPSSLEATDSSQLLALAAAKQALQDTGLSYERNRTSVILGVTGTQELVIPLSSRLGFPKWRRAIEEAGVDAERCGQIVESIAGSYVEWQENSFPGLLGNVVAGRISNRLDLGGTSTPHVPVHSPPSTWRCSSWPSAAVIWSSPAGLTRSTTFSCTCVLPRPGSFPLQATLGRFPKMPTARCSARVSGSWC